MGEGPIRELGLCSWVRDYKGWEKIIKGRLEGTKSKRLYSLCQKAGDRNTQEIYYLSPSLLNYKMYERSLWLKGWVGSSVSGLDPAPQEQHALGPFADTSQPGEAGGLHKHTQSLQLTPR